MKRMLALLTALILTCAFALPAAAENERYGIIHGGSLRMRSAPRTDAKVVKIYHNGTWVEILGQEGAFYKVIADDDRTGYMACNFVTEDLLELGSWATVENGNRHVNLRSGPSTDYRVIGRYKTGTRLEVMEYGNVFARVRVNGDTLGYMSNGLIRLDGQTEWEEDRIHATNGKNVNLRRGPSARAKIIRSYPIGTKAVILIRGNKWHKVIVNDEIGYMDADFLEPINTADADGVPIGQGVTVSNPPINPPIGSGASAGGIGSGASAGGIGSGASAGGIGSGASAGGIGSGASVAD